VVIRWTVRTRATARRYQPIARCGTVADGLKDKEKVYWQAEPTAGPSTAPPAMKLQEAPLRMTLSISSNYLRLDTFSIRQLLTLRHFL